MRNQNDNFKDSLGQWRDIAPRPGFEDRVWRRIQAVQVRPVPAFWEECRAWFTMQPAYARVASLLIGAAVALGSLWYLDGGGQQQASYEFSLLRSGTITGTYAQFAEHGGRR